jgi:putative transcriptional regulator
VTRMASQPKSPSRILEAVHETAADLHKLGLIDGRRMQHYDALCQQLEPETDAEKPEADTNCDHL